MAGLHDGHRDRVLERFSREGFYYFNEHERLELILFFSVPRSDTNEMAHQLLNKYHTIAGVMDAPEEELIRFKGITKRTVQLFKMIKETYKLYTEEKEQNKTYLCTTDEIGSYFQVFYSVIHEETITVMSLDNKCRFISTDIVGVGDISSVGVSIRKIVETVIKRKATQIVLCHNHPGGIALPSDADITVTKSIRAAMDGIGVCLKDHIILGGNDYVSLANSNLFNNLFKRF